MDNLWLSREVLTSWSMSFIGGPVGDEKAVTRAYEIWERASDLVQDADNSFDLSDTVLTLKRSVDHRLKLIETTYRLKEKSIDRKPKHYLEILAHLGIIRPVLFKYLFDIRNAIEHEDIDPPSQDRCIELVDIVWYFLKSTDTLVLCHRSNIEFESEDGYGGNLGIDWKSGDVELMGWFPTELVSDQDQKNFAKLVVKSSNTKGQLKEDADLTEVHTNGLDSDVCISGIITLNDIDRLDLFRRIFSLYS